MKLFRGPSSGSDKSSSPAPCNPKLSRRSSGLGVVARYWSSQEGLCILDLGATSPANIRYFTERSHKMYSEDLLTASTDPGLVTKDEQGNIVLDSRQFLEDNRVYTPATFDVVQCWIL